MYNEDVENFLAHYGKKGMKWGQRRRERNAEIKNARNRTASMQYKYNTLASDLNVKTMLDPDGKQATTKIAARALNDHIGTMTKHQKDFELANKYTTGEKWVAGTIYGALGTVVLASVVSQATR